MKSVSKYWSSPETALRHLLFHLLLHSYKQSADSPIFKKKTNLLVLLFPPAITVLLSFRVKLSKIAVCSPWLQFFSSYFLVKPFQSGFLSYHSLKLFLAVTNELPILKSNFQFSGFILLDLAAAFNTADYPLLLETLSSTGYQDARLLASPCLTGHIISVFFASSTSPDLEVLEAIGLSNKISPLFHLYLFP